MAAPQGNQFWKLRSKHGRDKLFATPELLWEAAVEYFEWNEENPLIEVDFRGRDLQRVEIPHMRALTIQGLCLYLGCSDQYFKSFKNQLRKDQDDFITVITQIEKTIYQQKFTGAAGGFLKENLIARELGLKDSTDLNVGGQKDGEKISVQFGKFNHESKSEDQD